MSKTKPAAAGAFAAATAALGAGVDAIFDQEGPLVSDLMLDMIDLSEQVRSEFEDEDNTLKELAGSIAAHGILQPILVRPRGHRYQLVAGERRYRASKLAGKPSIPAYIREITDAEFEDMQFAENIQRKNLTQLEQARRLQRDYEALGGNLGKLAAKHNKGKPWLSRMLGLLELPEQAARMIGENISADVDLINTVKQVEKADKQAAKDLVDQLKATRGQTDARATARRARCGQASEAGDVERADANRGDGQEPGS
jgi:ParB family chromosome partitioning protein